MHRQLHTLNIIKSNEKSQYQGENTESLSREHIESSFLNTKSVSANQAQAVKVPLGRQRGVGGGAAGE